MFIRLVRSPTREEIYESLLCQFPLNGNTLYVYTIPHKCFYLPVHNAVVNVKDIPYTNTYKRILIYGCLHIDSISKTRHTAYNLKHTQRILIYPGGKKL